MKLSQFSTLLTNKKVQTMPKYRNKQQTVLESRDSFFLNGLMVKIQVCGLWGSSVFLPVICLHHNKRKQIDSIIFQPHSTCFKVCKHSKSKAFSSITERSCLLFRSKRSLADKGQRACRVFIGIDEPLWLHREQNMSDVVQLAQDHVDALNEIFIPQVKRFASEEILLNYAILYDNLYI
jgi:hypothetical protein